MLESVAPILAALRKASPVPFVALGLATTFVLFAPQSWGTVVGVNQFREQHRELVGAVFLVSWSLVLAYGLAQGAREAIAWNARRHKRRLREESHDRIDSRGETMSCDVCSRGR